MQGTVALSFLQALYLLAPLLVAAALSAVVLRFDLAHALARPIDAGRRFHGERWLGDGKTYRGVVTAVVGAVIGVALQRSLGSRPGDIALLDYRAIDPLVLGLALGLGATLGELPNSFVKRRAHVAAGKTATGPLRVVFWIWDQVDLLVLTWPLLLFWLRPSAMVVLASVLLVLVIHPLVALIGWLVGARKSPR